MCHYNSCKTRLKPEYNRTRNDNPTKTCIKKIEHKSFDVLHHIFMEVHKILACQRIVSKILKQNERSRDISLSPLQFVITTEAI